MNDKIQKLNSIIKELKKSFTKKYGCVIFDISLKKLKQENQIMLSGNCLTAKQLELLKKAVKSEIEGADVHYDIRVLTSQSSLHHLKCWGRAEKFIVNVTSDFEGEKLSTQISPDDNYFKIILQKNFRSLVQLDDNTVGWLDDNNIYVFKKDLSETWDNLNIVRKGDVKTVNSIASLIDESFPYINQARYLHGGKSAVAIDCSALMQTIFRRAFGLILPRHSLDQMKLGIRVPKNDLQNADLVFARSNRNKIMHVGLAFFDEKRMIIHACLREKMVICESIDVFFKYYTFAGARRIVKEEK